MVAALSASKGVIPKAVVITKSQHTLYAHRSTSTPSAIGKTCPLRCSLELVRFIAKVLNRAEDVTFLVPQEEISVCRLLGGCTERGCLPL